MRESIFSLAEARKSPEMREVGRDMIRGGEGFVPIPASLTGKKSWLYYAPLPSTGWSLGVVFPDDELFADAQRLMQRTVAIAVLGLVFLAAGDYRHLPEDHQATAGPGPEDRGHRPRRFQRHGTGNGGQGDRPSGPLLQPHGPGT